MTERVLPMMLAVVCAAPLHGNELLPSSKSVDQVIEHYIDARLKDQGITAAAQADDSTLIRRLTLDLVGRIPTIAETRAFVESTDRDKRAKLVDRLMASSGFLRHQATELDAMLMSGTNASIRPYLLKALEQKHGWDQIFRELMLPSESDVSTTASKNAVSPREFLRARIADVDKLTTEVSVVFFGVNVSCARCHDHPLVHDWKQDHFFGMKSFLARTVDVGGFLGEREVGLVKFQTTKGENKQARMMFLTGKVVDAPGMKELNKEEEKREREALEKAKKDKKPLPPPKFSARQQLVDVALQPEALDFFAKSIVNRLWARFYGHGLVNPVDQMHSENPPSHPELLAWLARDTFQHNYDLRRLIRGLVMSQTYSRSSRWESGEVPLAKTFAFARVRPLTPHQLAASLRIASSNPQQFENVTPEELEKRIEGLEASGRGLASMFEVPSEDFQVSVGEALLFSNSDRVQKEILSDLPDRLLGQLKSMKDRKSQIEMAVRVVMCRAPVDDEMRLLDAYLAKRADRPQEALRQMVWALFGSSEFRFNH